MKTILTTFNAKYIHTSLALRWLYVVNKANFDIDFREYTIKEDIETAAEELLAENPDVIGISVSIWNVDKSREFAALLKKKKPDIIIILGGPEVSYEPQYFIDNWEIDYVISGEGEFVLGELLALLQQNQFDAENNEVSVDNQIVIPAVSSKEHLSKAIAQADINELTKYPSPYQLGRDKADLQHKIVYFESSRGCPYQCQYCLSSLEKGVRYFPADYIQENLRYLIEKPSKQIKFLDRTFNLNKKHTQAIFDFLIKHHRPNLSIQFEIYADLLNNESISYLNKHVQENYFRFEIGIQSTYEPTNIAIKRKQNFPLLADNIRQLMEGEKIDLHLDLIAGLPYESFECFVQSFNDVFELRAKEVQLGFLKLLRGTALRTYAEKYGLKYQAEAPYEVIYNDDISEAELNRIRDAEKALEKYWNSGRFQRTMNYVFDTAYQSKYFQFFDELGQFYNFYDLPHISYQLEELFFNLNKFLKSKGIDAYEQLRDDYYDNFTMRPSRFWQEEMDKAKRKNLLYAIGQDKDFLEAHGLSRKNIQKETVIHCLDINKFLLILFLEKDGRWYQRRIEYQFQNNKE